MAPEQAAAGPHAVQCPHVRNCFLEQAVAGLSIGLILISPTGRVVWLNRAAEQLLQVPASTCIGRTFREVLRDPQLATFWQEAACRDGNCMANVSVRWPRPLELKLNATQCRGDDGVEIGRALLFCDVTSDHSVKVALTEEVANRLLEFTDADREPAPAIADLTAQELRSLRLLGRGLSNAAIADQLAVAESTIRSHLKHVYRKLGLRSRAQAVRFAIRHRIA